MPEAKEEFDQATDWYERQEPGLGTRVVAQIREDLARIASDPETYAIVYRDVRKTLVRRFPFALIYRQESSEILVVSIFQTSRDPAIWKSRL